MRRENESPGSESLQSRLVWAVTYNDSVRLLKQRWERSVIFDLKINDPFYFLRFINACRKFAQSIYLMEILILKMISDFEGKYDEERNVFS